MHGRIACAWRLDDGELVLEVTVPANTSATVHVPSEDPESVREGDGPARTAPGITFLGMDEGAAVFRVGSGQYRFTGAMKTD